MRLTTPEAQNNPRDEFFIYTFDGAEQGQWKVSSRLDVRGLNIIGDPMDRIFILQDSKPNIFNALKRFLHQRGINISHMTSGERHGGIYLYLTRQQFNNDTRNINIIVL